MAVIESKLVALDWSGKLRRHLNSLRWWLIRRIANGSTVIMNAAIDFDKQTLTAQDKTRPEIGIIENCHIVMRRGTDDSMAIISIEEPAS